MWGITLENLRLWARSARLSKLATKNKFSKPIDWIIWTISGHVKAINFENKFIVWKIQ